MSRFAIYPYREEEEARSGPTSRRVVRPTLDVLIAKDDLEWRMKCLVDTGAPSCILPRGAADALMIDLESLPPEDQTLVNIVGKQWKAAECFVDLALPDFEGFTWSAAVRFLYEDWPMPFGVAGQDGFLDKWAVSFNYYHSYFIVEPIDQFDARLPVDEFEEFQRRFPDDYSPLGG